MRVGFVLSYRHLMEMEIHEPERESIQGRGSGRDGDAEMCTPDETMETEILELALLCSAYYM
jgi:hypothetical protein